MKKMLLCVAALALLCGCAKTEPAAPEQTPTKSKENITLTVKCMYGGGNGSPYGMQFACQPKPLTYGADWLKFDLKNAYVDYNGTGWEYNLEMVPALDVTIEGRPGYSGPMPVAFRPETYIDKNSLRTEPDISDRYNITYVVEGMPCY